MSQSHSSVMRAVAVLLNLSRCRRRSENLLFREACTPAQIVYPFGGVPNHLSRGLERLRMDFVIPDGAAGPFSPGSCHTVFFPPGTGFGFVSAFTKSGHIVATFASGKDCAQRIFQPTSPLSDLDNIAAGGSFIMPIQAEPASGAIATVSFINDGPGDGEIYVVAGASVVAAKKQPAVVVHRQLPQKHGTVVNIVFVSPCAGETSGD